MGLEGRKKMIEFESFKWWEWPLVALAAPFAGVAVISGFFVAIITGKFVLRLTVWNRP